jgi:predicted ATPase
LPELAEECDQAASRAQLLISTHSPFMINRLNAEQVWTLFRRVDGYTRSQRVADIKGIQHFVDAGATLGDLWMEGHFEPGNDNGRTEP